MLKDPNDTQTRATVTALLERLRQDPQYGIARILTHDEIVAQGGDSAAAFMVAVKPGFSIGGALQGDVVTSTPGTGTHGYTPDVPEMRSSFFAMGRGIGVHRDVGVIDMRQIAPTIAGFLGVSLPDAREPAINWRP
jgi:predicted AlkP superfamily pyrophosphatase or phosphodiesterase